MGVSTDDLILREKGHLPVIPFEERFNVVKAIKYVDEVIPQIDKNKQRIVDEYGIDAISVGDDWKGRFPITTCHVEYFSLHKKCKQYYLKGDIKDSKINLMQCFIISSRIPIFNWSFPFSVSVSEIFIGLFWY